MCLSPGWRRIGRNPISIQFILRADNDLTISDFWTFPDAFVADLVCDTWEEIIRIG